jgi:hypothetical protein
MGISELLSIVKAENLDTPVINGVGSLHLDAVVAEQTAGGWRVYLVDERDQVIAPTLRSFDDESRALEHVLRKLRQVAKSRQSMARLNARTDASNPPSS